MTAPTLSPAATALLNAIAAVTPASDPWARFPPVLTVSHVAEILGSSEDAVRELCRRGRIPPMRKRIGRYVADQVAFRAWLAEDDAR